MYVDVYLYIYVYVYMYRDISIYMHIRRHGCIDVPTQFNRGSHGL